MKKRIILSVSGAAIFLVAIIATPFIYNYYLHPLAKFKDTISNGEPFIDVQSKITKYCRKHSEDPELQCNTKGENMGIYQSSIFDNARLEIALSDNKVSNVLYVAD